MAADPLAPGCARANTPLRPACAILPAPRLAPGLASLAAAFLAMQDRPQIEAAIEILIAELDARDGSPDAEDDDPAGDFLDTTECGAAEANYRPLYGIDQSTGPVNGAAVNRDHYRKLLSGMTDAATRSRKTDMANLALVHPTAPAVPRAWDEQSLQQIALSPA